MNRALLIASLVVLTFHAFAQEQAPPSLQEQLDALKRGQERILQELEELRAALAERPARAEQPARSTAPTVFNLRGEPFKGEKSAPLAIIEYSDFECSHCAEFATEIFPQLEQLYIAAGKMRFYFRDLPEPGNAESLLKARVARCAGEQGKFWEMHDYFFAKHPALVGGSFRAEADAIGLDHAKLTACLKESKYSLMIQRSAAGAARMGFRGTPTFVIGRLSDNGDILTVKQILLGSESLEKFRAILDPLLAEPREDVQPVP